MVAEHWENPTCEALVRATVTEQAVVVAVDTPVEVFELSGDALFAFAGSARKDLNPVGIRSLNNLVTEINKNYVEIEQIKIIGHTDRIGSEASNYKLSIARANTVAEYLVDHGIARNVIVTEGRGPFEPVAHCGSSNQVTSELVACLQPNRRVVLEIKASRNVN
jgi:outer membrane protein OmpA-like peptidoglycan-associated protein